MYNRSRAAATAIEAGVAACGTDLSVRIPRPKGRLNPGYGPGAGNCHIRGPPW